MKTRYFILFLLCLVAFAACEKDIEVDLPPYESKIVVEGYIENDTYPTVFLSLNQSFSEGFNLQDIFDLDTATLIELLKNDPTIFNRPLKPEEIAIFDNFKSFIVMDALVVADDNTTKDTMGLYINPQIFLGDFMTPLIYKGTKFKGQIGGVYNLKIEHQGKEYTSQTSITKPFMPDSVWFEEEDDGTNTGDINSIISDDPSQRNYYAYFTRRIGPAPENAPKDKYFVKGRMGVWDDQIFQGKEKFEIPVLRGSGGNYDEKSTDEVSTRYKVNDSVVIKVCTMDNNSYWFWKTASSGTSSMSSPASTQTNIRGGALGVWCGYGVNYVGIRCAPQPK